MRVATIVTRRISIRISIRLIRRELLERFCVRFWLIKSFCGALWDLLIKMASAPMLIQRSVIMQNCSSQKLRRMCWTFTGLSHGLILLVVLRLMGAYLVCWMVVINLLRDLPAKSAVLPVRDGRKVGAVRYYKATSEGNTATFEVLFSEKEHVPLPSVIGLSAQYRATAQMEFKKS